MSSSNSRARTALLWAFTVSIPLGGAEAGACLVSRHFQDRFFSYENLYLATTTPGDFVRFISSTYFDPAIGWNNPKSPTTKTDVNCLGETITYHFDDGYRLGSASSGKEDPVALFGDSYVEGHEVGDDSTITSILASAYGVHSTNYGVGGYGTDQAVEQFKETLRAGRMFSTSVLVVMHEDIRRVANSFRPVYDATTALRFGLKPYVHNGTRVPLQYPTDFESFVKEARSRFRNDYWAKPNLSLPYSLSLGTALMTTSFGEAISSVRGQPFGSDYEEGSILALDLESVLNDFVSTAKANRIRPVVVFVPLNEKTYRVSEGFVNRVNARLGEPILHEFIDGEIDWSRYNLGRDGTCHPSAYGYGRLASYMARKIR
jgi:hypothetical protein